MVTEPNNNVNTTVEYQTAMLNSDSKLKVGIVQHYPMNYVETCTT